MNEDLKKLKELRDKGILSEEEFQEKVAKIKANIEEEDDGFEMEKSEENKAEDENFDDEELFHEQEDDRKDFFTTEVIDRREDKSKKSYENAINNGYDVDFSKIFGRAFEIFKAKPGEFIGFTVIYLVISIIVASIPIIGYIAGLVINPALAAGILIVAIKLMKSQDIEFKDFFLGFKFWLPLAVAAFLSSVFTVIGLIFLILPGIYLAVSFMFTSMFIIDKKLDFWPALEKSFKLVSKKFFPLLGLAVLSGLLAASGLLLCGVGLFVTIPISAIVVAVAYHEIIGVSKFTEEF